MKKKIGILFTLNSVPRRNNQTTVAQTRAGKTARRCSSTSTLEFSQVSWRSWNHVCLSVSPMSTSRDHTPKEAGRDRKLESSLSNIKLFGSPKWELEQYPIGANLASRMLFMAESKYGDIAGKIVADLGCGVGTLGIAACLYDAAQVIGVDVDADILNMALHNSMELEVDMELMQCDLAQPLPWRGSLVDTIVTFPPLGHRRKGVPDMEFLSNAFKVAQTVYSLHKTATRKQVKQAALGAGAQSTEVLCELRYELPAPYKMPEEEQEATIALDLWRFTMRSLARSCPAT